MQSLMLCSDVDESAILNLVLQRAGYSVTVTKEGKLTSENAPDKPIGFFLLTFRGNVPISLIHQLRAEHHVPIVIVTDPVPEDTLIKLWETPVDLVVSRPYSANLLLAQIRALSKRKGSNPAHHYATLDYPGLSLDLNARTVTVREGTNQPLTRLEFRLLHTLMASPGQVFLPEQLIEQVWGYSGEGDRNLVRGLIKRLRTKIEPDPLEPRYLLTQPGGGYYFNKYQYWEQEAPPERVRVLGWV